MRLSRDPALAAEQARRQADWERQAQTAWAEELRTVALRDAAGVASLTQADPPVVVEPEPTPLQAWMARLWLNWPLHE